MFTSLAVSPRDEVKLLLTIQSTTISDKGRVSQTMSSFVLCDIFMETEEGSVIMKHILSSKLTVAKIYIFIIATIQ